MGMVLFGIEEIGVEIEGPFGKDVNDIRLKQVLIGLDFDLAMLCAIKEAPNGVIPDSVGRFLRVPVCLSPFIRFERRRAFDSLFLLFPSTTAASPHYAFVSGWDGDQKGSQSEGQWPHPWKGG